MKRVIILGSLLILMAGVQAQQKKDTVLVVTLDSISAKKKSVILKIMVALAVLVKNTCKHYDAGMEFVFDERI
jgi:hypothetical protein